MPDTDRTNTPRIVACPTCGERVKWTLKNTFRPFCSERCKLIDLGEWASGGYTIPGDRDDSDVFSGDLDGGP